MMATKNKNIRFFDGLLRIQANPNCQNNRGESPLHLTASTECPEFIHMMNNLLTHPKININIQDYRQQTPAHKSVLCGTIILALLKEKGADFKLQDCHQKTALDYAIPMQREIILQLDTQLDRLKQRRLELEINKKNS